MSQYSLCHMKVWDLQRDNDAISSLSFLHSFMSSSPRAPFYHQLSFCPQKAKESQLIASALVPFAWESAPRWSHAWCCLSFRSISVLRSFKKIFRALCLSFPTLVLSMRHPPLIASSLYMAFFIYSFIHVSMWFLFSLMRRQILREQRSCFSCSAYSWCPRQYPAQKGLSECWMTPDLQQQQNTSIECL